jgi:uncharacterized protein (DUF2249 family)
MFKNLERCSIVVDGRFPRFQARYPLFSVPNMEGSIFLITARDDALNEGETLRLVNDHDLKPLYYQLMAERTGVFAWEPEQQGPQVWVIRIRKAASES